MKTSLLAAVTILWVAPLLAEETTAIDSRVIHQYSFVSLNFGYIPGHDDLPAFAGIAYHF